MQFNFGKNWLNFSKSALTSDKIAQAQDDFEKLFNGIELKGKTFVDIGFGQGLSLLIAKQKGASVIGCDINPTCEEALKQTMIHFPQYQVSDIPLVIGSILEQETINKITKGGDNCIDIIHSWGVLHHTGNMKKAIQNASSLVKENGYLVISIYNKHWTSIIWLFIKWLYNKLPSLLQKVVAYLFYPLIWLAKYLVTGENPTKMNRGMDFFYNVVDWVGGYPYEYASIDEVENLVNQLGFHTVKKIPAQVPTGCNEFIFRKNYR